MDIQKDMRMIDPTMVKRANRACTLLAAIVALYGYIVIIGALFHLPMLRNPTPWGLYTPINGGICALLTGLSILAAQGSRWVARNFRIAVSAVICIIAAITLAEWLFGWNAGIDQLLVRDISIRQAVIPGRMAGSAALAFLLLGTALEFLNFNRIKQAQFCSFLAFCVGTITLSGHTYGFADLLSFGSTAMIALPMSIAIILASAGVFLVHPDKYAADIWVSRSRSARIIRRLLPLALLVPAIGLVGGMGQPSGLKFIVFTAVMTVVLPMVLYSVTIAAKSGERSVEAAPGPAEPLAVSAGADAKFHIPPELESMHGPRFPIRGWVAALSVIGCVLLIGMVSLLVRNPQVRNEQSLHIELFALVTTCLSVVGLFLYVLNGYLSESRRWQFLREAWERWEEERRFRVLFDSIPQLAWTARPDGYVDFYNKGWYEYTGTTFDEMQGWGWQRVHDPNLLPAILESWHQCLKSGQAIELTFPLRRADGVFRWFITRVNPIKDGEGNVIRWVGITTDIDVQTAQLKNLNQKLKDSERRLKLALDAAEVGVYESDLETGKTWRSQRVDQIFGYRDLQPIWTFEKFLDHVLEEDRSRVEQTIKEAMLTGTYEFECRILRADKMIRWISEQGKVVKDDQGQNKYLRGTIADITERKKHLLSREELAAVVDSASEAIITETLDGTITSWNAGAERMYGYSAQEICGGGMKLIIPADRAEELATIQHKVANGESVGPYDTVRTSKQGKPLEVSVTVSPIKDATGKVVRVCTIARDVHARKQAEASLHEATEFLQSVFQSVPDAVVVSDKNGIIRSINSQAQKTFGYTSAELIGRPIEDLVPESSKNRHVIYRQEYMRSPKTRPMGSGLDLHAKHKDGREFPVDIRLSPINTSKELLVMAVVRDLTEQKAAEAERKKAEADSRAQDAVLKCPNINATLARQAKTGCLVFAGLALFIAVMAIAGNIFHIPVLRNPTPWGTDIKINAAISLLLLALSTLLVQRQSNYNRVVVLASGAIVSVIGAITLCEWLFGWNPGLDQLLLPDFSLRQGTAPGRMALSAAAAFTTLGVSLLALGAGRMVLSQACAFAGLCIGLVSLVGGTYGLISLLTFGAGTLIALPISIALILIGGAMLLVRPESGFMHVVLSPNLGGRVIRTLMPISMLTPVLLGIVTGFGVVKHLDIIILTVFTTVLLPTAVLIAGIAMERLDRQRDQALDRAFARREQLEILNRELETARDEALQVSRLKSAFIANISHELRTPLSGIIGNVELLLGTQESNTGETKDHLEVALSCSHSLLSIVNDLLDLSKIESGKFSLDITSFNLNNVIRDVTNTLSERARQKGLFLKVELDPKLPAVASGDPGRISQILLNLINNAIKFTTAGEVKLTVKLASTTDPNFQSIRFEVSDTGIGISAKDQQQLFKPFMQVDTSVTRKYGGAGLGLALSKNLVELMNGEIGVISEEGRGSTFWFVLPLMQSLTDFSPATAPPVRPRTDFSNRTVLIVEDNPVVQKIVIKQLATLGITSTAATNGKEAIELAQHNSFDLILMDCNLPDLSGLDVTQQIRSMETTTGRQRCPIVAMTAAAMKGDREICLTAGMDDYLSKPVTISQLRETLERWLKASNSERQLPFANPPSAAAPDTVSPPRRGIDQSQN